MSLDRSSARTFWVLVDGLREVTNCQLCYGVDRWELSYMLQFAAFIFVTVMAI